MIRTLLVDDEPIAISVLENHLSHLPDVEVVGTATSAVDALQWARSGDVDLIFLDIEMPGLSGVDLVNSLSDAPEVIFATAHRSYAADGFDLDAVDFLVKPIRLPRLIEAVEKYRRRVANRRRVSASRVSAEESAEHDAPVPRLSVRVDRQTVRIEIPSIRYIEGLSDYVTIRTAGDAHITKMTLTELAETLEPHGFARVHRSYVVNLARVDAFTTREVQVADAALPISRTYRQAVLDALEDHSAK